MASEHHTNSSVLELRYIHGGVQVILRYGVEGSAVSKRTQVLHVSWWLSVGSSLHEPEGWTCNVAQSDSDNV